MRELRCDVFDDLRFVREIACSCDEDDHHFARNNAVSDHDVAEPAFVAFFVVGFDTVVCANVFDSLNGFVVFGLLDQAGAHVDDVMASLLIESRDESAFPFSYRHLCFVSVVPRVFHAECRVHGDF